MSATLLLKDGLLDEESGKCMAISQHWDSRLNAKTPTILWLPQILAQTGR